MSGTPSKHIVILGAGQAGLQAAQSLREHGVDAPITLVGDETHPPYQRPPLSKGFLKGEIDCERLYLKPSSYYADRGIALMLGRPVGCIDIGARHLACTDGSVLAFDTLILATGTRPRIPRLPGHDLANVFTLRAIADVDALRPALESTSRVAIAGGGYVGLEVAAVLRALGKSVVVVEAEDRVLKRVTSPTISDFFTELHTANGVEILTGSRIAAIMEETEASGLRLDDGRTIAADAVLLAVGAVPNAEIAEAAGIATSDGILVDRHGRSSVAGVFACGDCARFPSRRYGRSLRLESVQNAIDQAKAIAATIAGNPTEHDPVPWFWSDQYKTKLQIAGLSSPDDRVTVEGTPGAGPFSVEYSRQGRLVAVDAVDNARAHMLSRRRIAEETSVQPEEALQ